MPSAGPSRKSDRDSVFCDLSLSLDNLALKRLVRTKVLTQLPNADCVFAPTAEDFRAIAAAVPCLIEALELYALRSRLPITIIPIGGSAWELLYAARCSLAEKLPISELPNDRLESDRYRIVIVQLFDLCDNDRFSSAMEAVCCLQQIINLIDKTLRWQPSPNARGFRTPWDDTPSILDQWPVLDTDNLIAQAKQSAATIVAVCAQPREDNEAPPASGRRAKKGNGGRRPDPAKDREIRDHALRTGKTHKEVGQHFKQRNGKPSSESTISKAIKRANEHDAT